MNSDLLYKDKHREFFYRGRNGDGNQVGLNLFATDDGKTLQLRPLNSRGCSYAARLEIPRGDVAALITALKTYLKGTQPRLHICVRPKGTGHPDLLTGEFPTEPCAEINWLYVSQWLQEHDYLPYGNEKGEPVGRYEVLVELTTGDGKVMTTGRITCDSRFQYGGPASEEELDHEETLP